MTRHQQDNYRRRHRRLQAMTAATIAVLATTSACNSDSDEPNPLPPESSTTSTPTETPTPDTDAEKATAGVERFLAIRDEAYRERAITSELNQVADEGAHSALQVTVQYLRDENVKVTGAYVHTLDDPIKVSAQRYTVVDCEDRTEAPWTHKGKAWPQYGPDGKLLPERMRVKYAVKLIDDAWKVTSGSWVLENLEC